ncbi:protein of unknown function [Microbispora rosea]|uniref:DUF397 domain-containing protein n=1 Tax=Microbispora rosea TaxID=58117 RepID=A0A1N7H0K1_9ACTN|nr:DUF397 domain-containing protein [Microbispora rosea]GIH48268.1 hypothetical protein Mro03_34470 [Microbispora rosea subsp. rosea]SIS18290.1 protein of unknown function [Microbispora rosea]
MADEPPFRDLRWRSACSGGNCVEVTFEGRHVSVRDGKRGDESPILTFTLEEWKAFVEGVKGGRFDPA